MIDDVPGEIDYLIVPIGTGTLAAALSVYFSQMSPKTKIIGVEPSEAAAMSLAYKEKKVARVEKISRFCDGSANAMVSPYGFQ
jgi:threonine dehydratase